MATSSADGQRVGGTEGRIKIFRQEEDGQEIVDYTGVKNNIFALARAISEMRTVENLARPNPVRERTPLLQAFLNSYCQLRNSLVKYLQELRNVKASCSKSQKGEQLAKSTAALGAPSQSQQSLTSKLMTDIKAIETVYRQLFVEGSLKRLALVCQMTGLNLHTKVDFDLGGWYQQAMQIIKAKDGKKCCDNCLF